MFFWIISSSSNISFKIEKVASEISHATRKKHPDLITSPPRFQTSIRNTHVDICFEIPVWHLEQMQENRMRCPPAARSPLGGTSPTAQLARWSWSQGHLQSATAHLRAILQNASALFTCYVPGNQAPCLKCPHMKVSLCENEALGPFTTKTNTPHQTYDPALN